MKGVQIGFEMIIDLEYELHNAELEVVRDRYANKDTLDGECVKEFTIKSCRIKNKEDLNKLRQLLYVAEFSLERYHNAP
jgi:hypothetical protein